MNYSSKDYNSVEYPFFQRDNTNKKIEDKEISYKINQLNISQEIKDWYIKNCSITQETYINDWTIFSLNNILERNKTYKKDNIYLVDLSYIYIGMGWIKVASYDYKLDKIIIRRDGGSSDWDRKFNYDNLKKYKSDLDIEDNDYINKIYNFIDFLNDINIKN